jgi:hypothetical protein
VTISLPARKPALITAVPLNFTSENATKIVAYTTYTQSNQFGLIVNDVRRYGPHCNGNRREKYPSTTHPILCDLVVINN